MFKNEIIESKIHICVVGLGYVGLPLAVEFSKKYKTVGYDLNSDRISDLNNNFDSTLEIDIDTLKNLKNITFTDKINVIKNCNIYIITVPTPVNKSNSPDLNPILLATKSIGKLLERDNVVIYESTVYPGLTEEKCVPILERESNLVYNQDFFCGYSPERINPGDKRHTLTSIVKITAGSNKVSSDFVDKLYKSIIKAGTYPVSSMAVAEAAKVIENTQRDVNIALINELAIIFNKLKLNTKEILDAAETKWNFLPFRPGLVGGHCIGVDPYYLTHKALEIGYKPEIILAGRRINDYISRFISDLTIKEMTRTGINPVKAKVVIFGLTFKENCPDLRNTKVIDIIKNLKNYNCEVNVVDPIADPKVVNQLYDIELVNFSEICSIDAIILAVSHDHFKKLNRQDWLELYSNKGVFIDVKSMLNKKYFRGSNITYYSL